MRYMLVKHRLLLFSLLLLDAAIRPVLAQQEFHPEAIQDEPWVKEVPCRGNRNEERRAFVGNREFRLCLDLSEDKLQQTSDGVPIYSELYITSYTKKGQTNLTAMEVRRGFPDGHPGLILEEATPESPAEPLSFSSRRVFKVPIQLTNQSRTGRYPIEVFITSGNDKAKQKVDFSLPILVPNSTSVLIEPQSTIDCWAGSKCSSFQLKMQNKLPYKISISSISISSGDLLDAGPAEDYRKDFDINLPPDDVSLVMQAKPITLERVLGGFGSPAATMTIVYKDEYGRSFWTQTPATLQVRPTILVIFILLILGAVVGTLVKAYVEKLERSKLISRETGIFIVTTFVSGIVVCVVALIANIKLIVWNESSYSAWEPKVLFLTAFVATINGLPLLYARLKISRSTEAPATAPPQTKGAGSGN